MKKLLLILAIPLLLAGCKKEEPDPVQSTNNTNPTDSNYVEYYLDGVKQTPGIISIGILNSMMQFVAVDTTVIDQSIGIVIFYTPVETIGNYYFPDTLALFVNNSLGLTLGQGNGTGSKAYSSAMCNNSDNNNANFEITKIDYETSYMSGTFEGKVGSYSLAGDSLEYVITAGKFSNVKFIH